MKGIVILCLFLTACGQAANPQFGAPDHNDFVGPSGTVVAYDADVVQRVAPEFYDQAFADTQECMLTHGFISQSYPGPVVRITSFQPVPDHNGFTDFVNGQITIVYWGAQMPHESVHYLLWRSGFNNADNTAHNHPAFDACGVQEVTNIITQ